MRLISPKFLSFLLVLSAVWLGCDRQNVPLGSPVPGLGVFFVATNGNDSWSGKLAQPNSDASDGPFSSLERALSAARGWESGWPWRKSPSIVLRGGTFQLAKPITLKPEDSHLRLLGYPEETPVLSGGRRITGWQEDSIGGRRTWVVELPEVRSGQWSFHQLWLNGKRATRARTPNRGYYPVLSVPDKTSSWVEGHTRFGYMGEHLTNAPTIDQAEIVVMNRWAESRLPVIRVDEEERMVYLAKRSVFTLFVGDLYYLEGNAESLDQAGEWFLDRKAGKLYYLPKPGEEIAGSEFVAPVLPYLLRVESDSSQNRACRDIVFQNLRFSHTEWLFPQGFETNDVVIWPKPAPEIGGFAQAAIGVAAAVQAQNLHYSRFIDCEFMNLGGYGLELGRGCQHNQVISSDFYDLGAGGIRIGTTRLFTNKVDIAHENVVTNCVFDQGGRVFHNAVGIWIGQSPGNRIVHNTVRDFHQTGISVGWSWGYKPALATNTIISHNHVHNIGIQSDGLYPALSDMGGVYTLGNHTGSVIANNLIHDVAAYKYGGWGIYLDEGTSLSLIRSNLAYRTTHGGFHIHYGASNRVQNNIFAFSKISQIGRTRMEPRLAYEFTTNIVAFDEGYFLLGFFEDDQFKMDWNLYYDYRKTGLPKVLLGTWEEWQARGHDRNSLRADPLFAGPTNNFKLLPQSPAWRLGFQPLDMSAVGASRPAPKKSLGKM